MKKERAGRSKASAQYLHAKKRAQERYGLELTKESYLALCRDIQEGRGTCLGKQSNRLSVWKLQIVVHPEVARGPKMTIVTSANVVYDKQRHTIVTFLPPGITDAKGVAL